MGDVPEQDLARRLAAAVRGFREYLIRNPQLLAQLAAEDARQKARDRYIDERLARLAATPDNEDVVTLRPGDYGPVSADDIAMVVRATGALITSVEVIPEYEEDVAATPDGPRRWQLPDEPGPEVTAVRGGSGTIYRRAGPHWQDGPRRGVESWWEILADGPLTDATPAADGQGGDGRDG